MHTIIQLRDSNTNLFLQPGSLVVATGLLFTAAIITLIPISLASAELPIPSIKVSDDFDSETVEGGIIYTREETEALPVEFVEEQITPPINMPRKSKNGSDITNFDISEVGHRSDSPATWNEDQNTKSNDTPSSEMSRILDVRDADIAVLAKAISKMTGRNYVIDSNVKGKVTIHLPSPVTEAEALRVFDSILLLKGFTTVPLDDNIWKIISTKDAKQTTIPLISSEDSQERSDSLVTEIIRLRHVQAEDMQQLLSQFVGGAGVINAFSGTNSVLIIDSAKNIERLKELIQQLDVPAIDQDITIIPIVHADAKDIADKINEILGEKQESTQKTRTTRTRTTQRRTTANRAIRQPLRTTIQSQSVQRRALPIKILPDERTNSIIVVADPELTSKVRALVEKLDSRLDHSGGRFYVYSLQHADAEQLAEILNQVISGAAAESDSSKITTGSSIARSQAAQAIRRRTPAPNSTAQRIAQALQRRNQQRQQTEGKVNFEGEITIAPDPATNSLIINATKADYLRLKEVIEALDKKRRLVLVEATLVEVTLSDEQGMGIELQGAVGSDNAGYIGQTNFGGLTNLLTNPAQLSDLTLAAASTGTLTLPGNLVIPSQAILISALSNNTNVNILSTPTILATDNEEAEIIVGENVPFVTSTSTDPSNLNNTFNQIERQDVGITLRITPQISTGDFVLLKIFIEISNVVAGTRNDPNGPTTTIRTTETTVEVNNAQMIVTGGLISDNITEATRGVPFFQDIPVVGHFFQRRDKSIRRTNLLVFITPRIVTDQYEAREETRNRTTLLEESVRKDEVSPNIREKLNSKAIDRVSEEAQMSDILASTITPVRSKKATSTKEQAAVARTELRLQKILNTQQKNINKHQSKTDTDQVIDITVSPKLPSMGKQQNVTINTKSTNASAIIQSTTTKLFVVLRDISEDLPKGDNLPYVDNKGTIGLLIPDDRDNSAYFAVGYKYGTNIAQQGRTFVCLGTFANANEAVRISPALESDSNWKELTPAELLTLGKSTWQKQ